MHKAFQHGHFILESWNYLHHGTDRFVSCARVEIIRLSKVCTAYFQTFLTIRRSFFFKSDILFALLLVARTE